MILPKHFFLKKTKISLVPCCTTASSCAIFITMINSDILYFQHSRTILHKCKVKQEFVSESFKTKKLTKTEDRVVLSGII